ncbi:MAG: NYN domain-containing protein [Melioribacteraceae bacterium]|nr:NYN domain-containing protein [Melioribacteraceae bacterium]
MSKVNVYVDGFNLYFGMMESGFDTFRWLNIVNMASKFLKEDEKLSEVKYFTSRVSNDPQKQKRQSTYIEALIEKGAKIIYGHYQLLTVECYQCGHIWPSPNEKMTDVNIATHLLVDAFSNNYDKAILISGDSDLIGPIRAVHNNFANKSVVVAFPPRRHNMSIASVAKGSFTIGRKTLKDNQLEDHITKKDGYVLVKPSTW